MPNFSSYNQPIFSPASNQPQAPFPGGPPQIAIAAPSPGTFIGNTVAVAAKITDTETIAKLSVLWNGVDVGDFSGPFGASYNFSWLFTPPSLNGQNVLAVQASGASGNIGKSEVIVYH